MAGSERCSRAARSVQLPHSPPRAQHEERIQDAYSIRCAPQVHGPVRDALDYVDSILATEINSATDNPLVFSSPTGDLDVVSAGNFHGQYIAQAMDLLALALTDLSSISERRASRLLDPATSYGLPVNLVHTEPGLNTGFSIAHCTMAALVSENKTLCWPASVDSIPTKANQEDHVSNSTWCARKAALIIENLQAIIAIELLIAAQAISLVEPFLGQFRLGTGTALVLDSIRQQIPALLEDDRWIHTDVQAVVELVRTGRLREVASAAITDEGNDAP